MASIFPFISPTPAAEEELPVYRDVDWDYIHNKPVFVSGDPLIVSGLPAIKSWAWRALYTERFLNEVYSWNYGNEMMRVIGSMWDPDVKISELSRYCRECLMASPYIIGVRDIVVTFADARVTMSCRIDTVYGTDQLEVVA